MYEYLIKGEGFAMGRVKRIGRTTGVILDRDWEGKDVIVILKGDVHKFVKIEEKE